MSTKETKGTLAGLLLQLASDQVLSPEGKDDLFWKVANERQNELVAQGADEHAIMCWLYALIPCSAAVLNGNNQAFSVVRPDHAESWPKAKLLLEQDGFTETEGFKYNCQLSSGKRPRHEIHVSWQKKD